MVQKSGLLNSKKGVERGCRFGFRGVSALLLVCFTLYFIIDNAIFATKSILFFYCLIFDQSLILRRILTVNKNLTFYVTREEKSV